MKTFFHFLHLFIALITIYEHHSLHSPAHDETRDTGERTAWSPMDVDPAQSRLYPPLRLPLRTSEVLQESKILIDYLGYYS